MNPVFPRVCRCTFRTPDTNTEILSLHRLRVYCCRARDPCGRRRYCVSKKHSAHTSGWRRWHFPVVVLDPWRRLESDTLQPTLATDLSLTHGFTGWVIGDRNMDDTWLRIASVNLRIAVVNCEYRCVRVDQQGKASTHTRTYINSMAPEHPFPTAADDCFAALKYVASNPEKFSSSLKKGFLVGGASAGGNLAAVVSHLARDDPFFKDKPLTGQYLQIPVVVHYEAVPKKSVPNNRSRSFERAHLLSADTNNCINPWSRTKTRRS